MRNSLTFMSQILRCIDKFFDRKYDMDLRFWRHGRGLTLNHLAELLEIRGAHPGATLSRWEIGRARPDANVVERIEIVTEGAVRAQDMHATRLSWLREHGRCRSLAPPSAGLERGQRSESSDRNGGGESSLTSAHRNIVRGRKRRA